MLSVCQPVKKESDDDPSTCPTQASFRRWFIAEHPANLPSHSGPQNDKHFGQLTRRIDERTGHVRPQGSVPAALRSAETTGREKPTDGLSHSARACGHHATRDSRSGRLRTTQARLSKRLH